MATINGTAGNDNLSGTAADDIINGLAGDDTLYGGDGTDTYLFSAGWGKDVIDNQDFSNSADAIVLDATVDVSDIAVSWSVDRDLILTNINTQDQITVTDFDDPNTTMDEIRFASGVVWRPPVITSNDRTLSTVTSIVSLIWEA